MIELAAKTETEMNEAKLGRMVGSNVVHKVQDDETRTKCGTAAFAKDCGPEAVSRLMVMEIDPDPIRVALCGKCFKTEKRA
jgi:hypothetical protein